MGAGCTHDIKDHPRLDVMREGFVSAGQRHAKDGTNKRPFRQMKGGRPWQMRRVE